MHFDSFRHCGNVRIFIVCVRMSVQVMASPGDRILIVKPCWIDLIATGAKTLEVRGKAYRPGKYFLGYKRQILAVAQLGKPFRITTTEQWLALRSQHCVMMDDPPYKRTFALPILSAHRVGAIPFHHPRGAINLVIYRA